MKNMVLWNVMKIAQAGKLMEYKKHSLGEQYSGYVDTKELRSCFMDLGLEDEYEEIKIILSKEVKPIPSGDTINLPEYLINSLTFDYIRAYVDLEERR